MKPSQIAQLQELSRCWFPKRFYSDMIYVRWALENNPPADKHSRAFILSLWHQYRHQIAAMARNRQAA